MPRISIQPAEDDDGECFVWGGGGGGGYQDSGVIIVATKVNLVVHHHKLECLVKRLDCCAQDHGNFVGSKLH